MSEFAERILENPRAEVRPPGMPVPPALLGTATGNIFGVLARMTEGNTHERARAYVKRRLSSLDFAAFDAESLQLESLNIDRFVERFAVCALARLMGVSIGDLPGCFADVRDLSEAISEHAGVAAIEYGNASATRLLQRFGTPGKPFEEMANDIGLLVQSYQATRSLIANTLASRIDGAPVRAVRNTRRYFAHAEEVIVDLPPDLQFGLGRHECPGRSLAQALTTAAIAHLERHGPLGSLAVAGSLDLANARIPLFNRTLSDESEYVPHDYES